TRGGRAERDMELVRRCDWVIELGPGGGSHGGRVMYAGSVRDAVAGEGSTGDRLRNDPVGSPWRDPREFAGWARFAGLSADNLDDVSVAVPAGALTTVTGVPGSGTSSLPRSGASLVQGSGRGARLEADAPQALASGDELARASATAHFEALQRVGLGGLLLGQSSSTLSGGEAQRLRLAAALRARKRRERSLLILDEPANGLHPTDAR